MHQDKMKEKKKKKKNKKNKKRASDSSDSEDEEKKKEKLKKVQYNAFFDVIYCHFFWMAKLPRHTFIQALDAEDKRVKQVDAIMQLDERKRPYNSLYEVKAPTEEEMEAFRMKRIRPDDPMASFLDPWSTTKSRKTQNKQVRWKQQQSCTGNA